MLWKDSVETLQLCTKVQVIEHFLFERESERERDHVPIQEYKTRKITTLQHA